MKNTFYMESSLALSKMEVEINAIPVYQIYNTEIIPFGVAIQEVV